MADSSSNSRSAFFYGTLMAPQVLHRVCHGSMSPSNPIYTTHSFITKPAILHDHRRHRVRNADYPAVIPCPGASVRGTYVTGLTDADIWRLDIFEGDEYARREAKVKILTEVGDESGVGNVEGEEVPVETYIWIAGEDRLEKKEWDFGEFQREKMRFWVGSEGAGEYAGRSSIIGKLRPVVVINADMVPVCAEVDEAVAAAQQQGRDGTGGRGANGHITHALTAEQEKADPLKSAV
jgi:gamma-glutamylcyclotransferase (GGCT)/AIG2-like uncharacterized protein YtfP